MATVLLLIGSNVFMTIAWYGHLKFKNVALWKVILASWLIALLEYCLQVPANRLGAWALYGVSTEDYTGSHNLVRLHGLRPALSAGAPRWNYLVSFLLVCGAVYFAFLPGAAQ